PRVSTLDSTIASTRLGITRKKSTTRSSTARVSPVKWPAIMPTVVPITIDMVVAANPTSREAREPHSSIVTMSRPEGSVPNQWRALGGSLPSAVSWVTSSVSAGTSTGASSASVITTSSRTAPIGPDRVSRNSVHTSRARARRRSAVADRRGAATADEGGAGVISGCLQPGVQHPVDEVGDEVHQDHDGGEDHEGSLQQWQV